MTTDASETALVVVDNYNDFLSPKGAAWTLLKEVGKKNQLVPHIVQVLDAARKAGLTIAYAPHARFRKGMFDHRKFLHPGNFQQLKGKGFAEDSFGGEWYKGTEPKTGDIVASEHSCSSGFAGTNLFEQLESKGVTHLVLFGCITNSCIEATARSAVDLGYHVTVITDAIAGFSPKEHDHAITNTLPLVTHALASTEEFLAAA